MRFHVILCVLMFVNLSGCEMSRHGKVVRIPTTQATEVLVTRTPKRLKGIAGIGLSAVMAKDRKGNDFEVVVGKNHKLESNETIEMVPVYIERHLFEANYGSYAPE